MSTFQRVLLMIWAAFAICLLFAGAVELWMLVEGAVRKPHNSRLNIFFAFAMGIAIAASVIGTLKGRADAFQAMQAFGVLIVCFGTVSILVFAWELENVLTIEVRDWDIRKSLQDLAIGLAFCVLGVATFGAFRLSPTKPNR